MKIVSSKKGKRKKRQKTVILTIIMTLLICVFSFWGFLKIEHYQLVKASKKPKMVKVKKGKPVIYPTIYIGGSGGNPKDLYGMMAQVAPQYVSKSNGISFAVDISEDNEMSISGQISETNHFPQIDFNTVKGTSEGEPYSIALQKMMTYLTKYYTVPYVNLVGFSSGGTGALYYMIDTGGNPNFPPVQKFVSFDSEYNNNTPLREGETLRDILKNGPSTQTLMYQYIAKGYQRVSSKTKILMLMGDYNSSKQTDGTIPWGDGFSVYHLFKENGNATTWTIYPTQMKHAADKNNPTALAYIKNFLFGNKNSGLAL